MAKSYKIIISVLLALFLLFLLLRNVSLDELLGSFKRIDWQYVFFAFVSYFFVNVFRAVRFRVLLGESVSQKNIFSITLIHNFLTNLLPFRTGELSYIYLIGRALPQGFSQGIGTLFLSRFFDLLIISNLFLASLYFVSVHAFSGLVSGIIAIVVFGIACLSLLAVFSASYIFRFFAALFLKMRHFFSFFGMISARTREIEGVLAKVRGRDYFFKIFFLSCMIWFLNYGLGIFLLRAVSLQYGFFEAVFIFSLPMLVSEISPVQAFANIGLYEWSLVGGLALLGIERSSAVQASIAIHGIEIIFSLLLGIVGFIIMFLTKNLVNNRYFSSERPEAASREIT